MVIVVTWFWDGYPQKMIQDGNLSDNVWRSRMNLDMYIYIYNMYMAGVQNSRSQGLYAVRRVGIEKLILHFGYEAGRN